jgi:signal transduction histidine kinase
MKMYAWQAHGLLTAGGSGLGLRVSRRLAEAERGRLWASSGPGEGSTFYLELPLSEPSSRHG